MAGCFFKGLYGYTAKFKSTSRSTPGCNGNAFPKGFRLRDVDMVVVTAWMQNLVPPYRNDNGLAILDGAIFPESTADHP